METLPISTLQLAAVKQRHRSEYRRRRQQKEEALRQSNLNLKDADSTDPEVKRKLLEMERVLFRAC